MLLHLLPLCEYVIKLCNTNPTKTYLMLLQSHSCDPECWTNISHPFYKKIKMMKQVTGLWQRFVIYLILSKRESINTLRNSIWKVCWNEIKGAGISVYDFFNLCYDFSCLVEDNTITYTYNTLEFETGMFGFHHPNGLIIILIL